MRALLSAVGTRGDVQPIVALALRVRELGHEARLCVPPNFVAWVRSFAFDASPVGLEMRFPSARRSGDGTPALTEAELRRMREVMPDLITDQFDAIAAAADGCDVILGGNAHQYAARSIAEYRGIRYVTAVYAPVALPSPDHAPPPAPGLAWEQASAAVNVQRWNETIDAWNARGL
jgi:vancomycin aglycone glucosyltransferase